MAKNCKIKRDECGKYYCVTHNQYLLYVYCVGDSLGFRCQVGEDSKPKSKITTVFFEGSER